MNTMKTMMAVAAFALAIGNAQAAGSYDRLDQAKPINLDAWRKETAQGGPSFQQTVAAVKLFIGRTFKDPHSVEDLDVCVPVFNARATVHKDWLIVFRCNAKNSFGAYVGLQQFVICWKDGAIDVAAQQNLGWWQDFQRELQERINNP